MRTWGGGGRLGGVGGDEPGRKGVTRTHACVKLTRNTLFLYCCSAEGTVRLIDRCSQPSSEKRPPAADRTNT